MKVIAIGDSITEGYPYSHQSSWVHYAVQKLNVNVVNQGICGNLTRDMRMRFRQDVLALDPTHVIILGGTNDAALGHSVAHVSANFTAMVGMAQGHGIIPILGLPLPSLVQEEEKVLTEYRDWINAYAVREDLSTVDFYAPFWRAVQAGEASKLFLDDVHPTREGYVLMGKAAVQSLGQMMLSMSKLKPS